MASLSFHERMYVREMVKKTFKIEKAPAVDGFLKRRRGLDPQSVAREAAAVGGDAAPTFLDMDETEMRVLLGERVMDHRTALAAGEAAEEMLFKVNAAPFALAAFWLGYAWFKGTAIALSGPVGLLLFAGAMALLAGARASLRKHKALAAETAEKSEQGLKGLVEQSAAMSDRTIYVAQVGPDGDETTAIVPLRDIAMVHVGEEKELEVRGGDGKLLCSIAAPKAGASEMIIEAAAAARR